MTTTTTAGEYLRVSVDKGGRERAIDEQHADDERAADEHGTGDCPATRTAPETILLACRAVGRRRIRWRHCVKGRPGDATVREPAGQRDPSKPA
jgi:hypothetical protein